MSDIPDSMRSSFIKMIKIKCNSAKKNYNHKTMSFSPKLVLSTILDKIQQIFSRNHANQVFLRNVLLLIFCNFLVKLFKFQVAAGCSPSISSISGIFLKFPNFLRFCLFGTRKATNWYIQFLVIIIQVRFSCGEGKLFSNEKKSTNILSKIVVKYPDQYYQ